MASTISRLGKCLLASSKRPYIVADDLPVEWLFNLSGTEIYFRTPTRSDFIASFEHAEQNMNLFDQSAFKPGKTGSGSSWLTLLATSFSVLGRPLLEGKLGEVRMVASIAKVDKPVDHFTLFNPQHMEFALRRRLYYSRGPGGGGSTAPVDWTVYKNIDLQFPLYDCTSYSSEEFPSLSQGSFEACLPISGEHFLMLVFARGAKRYTPAIDTTCRKLVLDILDTLKIQLSPSAQAQKEEAANRWPDAQYSEHRDPEPWVYEEMGLPDDYVPRKINDFIEPPYDDDYVVVQQASPPPEFKE